jgi:hypothetical protein
MAQGSLKEIHPDSTLFKKIVSEKKIKHCQTDTRCVKCGLREICTSILDCHKCPYFD